jgi:hypothetical protein
MMNYRRLTVMHRPTNRLQARGPRLALTSFVLIAALFALSAGHARAASDDHGHPTPTPTPSPSPSPSPSASPTPGAETRVEIDLAGPVLNGAKPRGEAELRRRADGSREFEVQVSNVSLPVGTRLNVLVDGGKVGELVLTSLLAGKFELDTRDGQSLPSVVNGTTVAVADQTGAIIVAGSFTSTLPPPGPTPTPTPTPTPQPGADNVLRIRLVGAAVNGVIPKGSAEFTQSAAGRRELEVGVEDLNLPAGTVLNVLVDNVQVGQITLGRSFKGRLEIESEHGQSVPAVAVGTTVAVTNGAGATLLAGSFGADAAAAALVNPLEDASFFVRQHYIDFLNRAPEQSGLDAWVGVLARCPDDGAAHPDCDRVQVSSGFYQSPEFAGRGYFIYRAYDAGLGRLPLYAEFLPELGRIGEAQTEAELEAHKSAYLDDMMHRAEFADRYRGLTDAAHAEEFVTRLEQTAGVHLASHDQLVADMHSGVHSAAQTLRAFLDSPEVNDHFFFRGFVTMQYFGYLRRDPETAGWNAWVNVLTNGTPDTRPGDYRTLINGFVNSREYRGRFGRP